MKGDILLLAVKNGPLAAIIELNNQSDPLRALITYNKLVKDLYWKEKNLHAAVTVAQAAITHGLKHADEAETPELVSDYHSKIKPISYNLASYTWPGWDEPGIEIDEDDLAVGLQAAETNLRMAIRLKRDPLPMAYAHWVLAAQLLASGDRDGAKKGFETSAALARQADEHPAVLLADGFAALVQVLNSPRDAAAIETFEAIKSQFKDVEHGEDYIKQLNTARKVFSRL